MNIRTLQQNAAVLRCGYFGQRGIALLMVIMTLSALLLIGVPFFMSMTGFSKTGDSARFSEITQAGSYGAVQWAADSLAAADELKNDEPVTDYGALLDRNGLPALLRDRKPLHSGARVQDETGRIDVNSLTLRLARNLMDPDGSTQADDKIVMWPIRPEGNQGWGSAERNSYRPFLTVSSIREISNIVDLYIPVPPPIPPPPPPPGWLDTDIYMNIRDCLRVDYERIRSGRWFKASCFAQGSGINSKTVKAVFSPVLNRWTLVYIRDESSGAYEYNFCTSVSSPDSNNLTTVRLQFGLRQSYEAGTSYIAVPERVPVNINTASYKTLKAVLRGISGNIAGSVTVSEEDAETVAAAIVSERRDQPFTPDLFMEYDIASVIDSASPDHAKAALIKAHAFNPYDSRITLSTVGFRFASERIFRISGMSAAVNPNVLLTEYRGTEQAVVNIFTGKAEGSDTVWITSSQYEMLRDSMFRRAGLITGPNPLQASDFGTVPIADFSTKEGIDDFEENDTGYVMPAPLSLHRKSGYNEHTSFVLHADSGTKSTILNGDTGTAGDKTNSGDAAVYDAGSPDAAKSDLTPEGIALGTDEGQEDFLEYTVTDGKITRDTRFVNPVYDSIVYEGFSFECWFKPPEWNDTHYFFDICRTADEEPDQQKRDFQNRVSLLYGQDDFVIRIQDTSIKQQFAELRQKASFAPGKWYHIKAVVRGGAETVSGQVSTEYKAALFVDGKACWKGSSGNMSYPKLGPGADLKDSITAAEETIKVEADDGADLDSIFPASGGVVQIGRERIEYGERNGINLKDCIRGSRGTDAVEHSAGSRVLVFGYSCRLVDVPLMTGGGLLLDRLYNAPNMPRVTVAYKDEDTDGNADFSFSEGDVSIEVPADYILDDEHFPERGYLEIRSGGNNAIVYFTRAGNTLTLVWDDITTDDEDTLNLTFPEGTAAIDFYVISIQADTNENYPDANEFDGDRGYIQIDDEWFQYGRENECESGKQSHGNEDYFVGPVSMRNSAGMGGDPADHDPGAGEIKVIPVFRVDNSNQAPLASKQYAFEYNVKDRVTIVDVNDTDASIEDRKEQMAINCSGRDGGFRNWVAFTDNVLNEYTIGPGTRILKFPSGEMPALLSETIVVGNSRIKGSPFEGEMDEILINRQSFRTAYVYAADPASDITEAEDVETSDRFIEIRKDMCAGLNLKKTGFLRMNSEVFAFVYDSDVTGPPDRYRLKLIKRGCLGTEQTVHRQYDTVMILEGIPCTTVKMCGGEAVTLNSSWIPVESMQDFPPFGFVRINDEIIGYTYKDKDTSGFGIDCFWMEKGIDGSDTVGVWRGRFGTDPAAHAENALVTWFPARYPDMTPLRFKGGSVTHRWDPAGGIYFRKVLTRDNTVFGLEGAGDDLIVKAFVPDENGNPRPLPANIRLRILAGAGRNVDWTEDPSGHTDFTDDLQEFIIVPGQGGGSAVSFDMGARRTDRLEIRVYFEYLPGVWDPGSDSNISDPDLLNWKVSPVIQEIKLKVTGRNAVYETVRD